MGRHTREYGFGGGLRARIAEGLRWEEVRAGSLKDFANRATRHPYFPPRPGDIFRAVFPEAEAPAEEPRVPEVHVSVRPTYRGLEFSVRPPTGPRRIVYEERDPSPVAPEVALQTFRRQQGETDAKRRATQAAQQKMVAAQQQQVPPFDQGILKSLAGHAQKVLDFAAARAEWEQAFQAESDQFEMHRVENDLRAYRTFQAREPQLRAEISRLLPDAQVSIAQQFGRQDLVDQVSAAHPDVTGWAEPRPRRASHTWRRRRGL